MKAALTGLYVTFLSQLTYLFGVRVFWYSILEMYPVVGPWVKKLSSVYTKYEKISSFLYY